MKKTLIALMALAGVASAESVSLETQIVKGKETYALFSDWQEIYNAWNTDTNPTKEGVQHDTSVIEAVGSTSGTALTFYVSVSDLLGGNQLIAGQKYELDTFSWVGSDSGYYTGGDRKVTITNLTSTSSVSVAMPGVSTKTVTVTTPSTTPLTFVAGDLLKITFTGVADDPETTETNEAANVYIQYIDAVNGNNILGSASALNASGTGLNYWHVNKNNNGNGLQTGWKNDAPIIQLTAHAIPEPATATLSLLALAGLCARRRRA